jgi:hypothetical protein
MDSVVTVAEFLGVYPLLGGPGFGGGTVLIGAAYIESLAAPEPAKPGKGVGG